MTGFLPTLEERQDHLIQLRRDFHQHPELALEEHWTARAIEKELDRLGIEHSRIGATGVLGIIHGAEPGRTVGLRADIDGLPIEELNDVSYRSIHKGKMHACGHDSHIAALLGAAQVLREATSSFPGIIKLIFQPAEETGYGALDFIEAGVLDDIDRILGLHAASDLPPGTVAVVPGLNFAAVDHFDITFHGVGAHVSRPHLGADALYIGSAFVVGAQALVSRRTDPTDTTIIGIGKLTAGTAYNSVAETAHLEGTTRTVTPENRAATKENLVNLATATAQLYGGSAEVRWREVTPSVVNPEKESIEVAEVARELGPDISVITNRKYSLGGDNFAEFQNVVPGVYAFFGTGNSAIATTVSSHHSGWFDIDEHSLPVAAALYADTAYRWLTVEEL